MNGHHLASQHQSRQMSSLHHHLTAGGGAGGPISIKRETQHWSLSMLSGAAGASGLSSGGGLVTSAPSSSDAAAIAAAAAAASSAAGLHGLDAYAVSNAMLNNSSDDIFVSKAKTPKLELQNGHLFGEMSPDGMNNNNALNGGMNENSPASSSSSLAAAAAALIQANHNNMGSGMMCNSLSGRANSLSMDGSVGDMNGMLQRASGATTSFGCPPSASGFGGSSVGNDNDSMQPRQRRKVPEGELCAVCSDRATGYHYGVASCNGCKTFFRRTIVSDHQFVCQYQGKCDVNKNVRCACRYCRFQKCVAVGMDQRAIQNDRDRIGPTKKFRLGLMGANGAGGVAGMMGASSGAFDYGSASKRNGSLDEDQLSVGSMSPTGAGSGGGGSSSSATAATAIAAMAGAAADSGVIKRLVALEELTNQLRKCVLDTTMTIPDTLRTPSLLGKINELETDPNTLFTRLYPAALNDIQLWNVRELKLCFEWAKAFDEFTRMSTTNQFFLLKHVAFAINILNRLYYSLDHGPDKIVYPTGAFITREPQSEVIVPGCCSVYQRQMDEIMTPLRQMGVSLPEFATFKAILLFNPDALNVSPDVKSDIARERSKYLQALFYLLVNNHGMAAGVEKYGNLLMMAPSLQNIINQNNENMQVMELFGNFWRVHSFVKELCLSNPKIDELPPEQQDRILPYSK